ncbi:unnamed protein product [Sphagnum jensenii]|uniref:Protein kinase domain-containing protein n=1 Tax=Sphagnum jensenii TaxID=128206 RepID=A0ABP1BPX5_9BRYO
MARMHSTNLAFATIILLLSLLSVIDGATDAQDVTALTTLYVDLQQPPQLTNWNTSDGDPCTQNWLGVVCVDANVTELHLSNLGLTGQLGYGLSGLQSLLYFNVSTNNIGGIVPSQLPPSIQNLILAGNHFMGSLPYSIHQLSGLIVLDLSQNAIGNGIPDVFASLVSLTTLDLSYNTLTGGLPNSVGDLTSLRVLNIQNNQFTGSIPSGLHPPTFIFGGNQFSTSPAPPPPPSLPPAPQSLPPPPSSPASAAVVAGRKHFWTPGQIAGIAIAALFLLVATSLGLMFCLWRFCGKRISVSDEEKVHAQGGSQAQPLSSPVMKGKILECQNMYSVHQLSTHCVSTFATAGRVEEVMIMRASPVVQILKAPPSLKGISEKGQARLSSGKSLSTVIAATAFSIADLQAATNSFAQENLIGEGSLGRVYRGDFPNGQVVAVKKLDTSAAQVQDNAEFLAAVCTMAHLQHANIMELIGYCAEHGQHLLVYQYMNGGTLNDTLHTSDKTAFHISWNMRVKIALGAARALEYLHEVCLPAMVHRNFKSANILLDDETIPHLSDCGIAALIPIDGERQRQMSAQMLGSLGYSAPEYTMSGHYTMQSDVYCFGVVLLELLTGRKPFDSTRTRSEQSLVRWATPQLHDIDALVKMVDPALKGMYPAKSLSRFADIIALCVQPEPEFRPPMSEVVEALVRLMQRASLSQQRSRDNSSGSRHISDQHEPSDFT